MCLVLFSVFLRLSARVRRRALLHTSPQGLGFVTTMLLGNCTIRIPFPFAGNEMMRKELEYASSSPSLLKKNVVYIEL